MSLQYKNVSKFKNWATGMNICKNCFKIIKKVEKSNINLMKSKNTDGKIFLD